MPTIDLSNSLDRERLEELIESDINDYCIQKYEHGHRNHLGASELGKPCSRQLWYKFRWCKSEQHDGRMLRLFNVGHSAEPRFIDYLRGIGFEVKEFADDGKQFRISGVMGHYGGSLDGMCKAPARYNISEDLVLSVEFKTNGTGSGFNKVSEQHLSKAKPEHWAQACQYGFKRQLKYCLYLIENKNDSTIKIKVVPLDWNYGQELEKKAERIILATEPPNKISENPAFDECKWCTFKGICHFAEIPEKNCRSCRMCSPVASANWHCNRYQQNVPLEFIKAGCDQWVPV